MTFKRAASLGAPFLIIDVKQAEKWCGATEDSAIQYSTLLTILDTEIIDDSKYNILKCNVEDIDLIILDKTTPIYKVSDKTLLQIEFVSESYDFNEQDIVRTMSTMSSVESSVEIVNIENGK